MTHIHFIGIGGSGLSAIARLLLESGYTVSGSDRTLTPFAEEVRRAGATVYIGHHPRNLTGVDWVVRSSAVTDDNPEVEAAKRVAIADLRAFAATTAVEMAEQMIRREMTPADDVKLVARVGEEMSKVK